jgi:hypothetical protein
MSIRIAGGTSDDLEETRLGSQKPDLFSIEDTDEARLWEVESFAEEIDSDDDIDRSHTEVTEDLESFEGLDLGVEISHFESIFCEVECEVFT